MRTLAAEKVAIVCEIRVRNSVCVWIQKKERRWTKDVCFHHHGRWLLFSFLSRPQDFSLFWKRDFLFLPPVGQFDDVTTKQTLKSLPKKSPQTQKKRGRSRHNLLSVVSRSPGKLFKRTLTYRGKLTQRYVKRERERKEEEAHFLLRLARVVVRTRGGKVARRRKEFSEQTTSA